MPLALSLSTTFVAGRGERASPTGSPDLTCRPIGRLHPSRKSIEAFIARAFQVKYGATVTHFADVLLGSQDETGNWIAALGFSPLAKTQAFLERYLDEPAERVIARHPLLIGKPVPRADIAELGNLAATRPGASRALILQMTRHLHEAGFKGVVFTATRELSNSFAKLKYNPIVIAAAQANKLQGEERLWGSYYESNPQVMYGNVDAAYARFYAPI